MNSQLNSASNITHVRGLYTLDESVPISKFVYKKDRSYIQDYRKKKNANQIRRDCFRTMSYFEPAYYVKMMEYQQIQEKARYRNPSQVPFYISIDTLAKNSSDLQCPHFSRLSNSRNMSLSSLSWVASSRPSSNLHKKKKSQTNRSHNSGQRKIRSKSVSNSRNHYYVSSSSYVVNNNSHSPNNSPLRRTKNYKRKEIEVTNLQLKKYFYKWLYNWCGKNTLMMSKLKAKD